VVGVSTDMSSRDPGHGRARYANQHFRCKKK
jgi:hypothetical protein